MKNSLRFLEGNCKVFEMTKFKKKYKFRFQNVIYIIEKIYKKLKGLFVMVSNIRSVSPEEAIKYVSAIGNEIILINHIEKIEECITKYKENQMESISSTPFFYAWLSLYCERFANSLFYSYFWLTGDSNIYDFGFRKIINCIENYHKSNQNLLKEKQFKLPEILECVYQVIDLRHCFQHGGIPNFLREIKITDQKKIIEMIKPFNFLATREIFKKAFLFTSTLPKPAIGR